MGLGNGCGYAASAERWMHFGVSGEDACEIGTTPGMLLKKILFGVRKYYRFHLILFMLTSAQHVT